MSLKLDRRGRLVVPETSLEQAIVDLLTYDNWRVFRFGWALTEAKRELGEVGSADLLAMRYADGDTECTCEVRYGCACAQVLWCEVKSLRGRASGSQRLWHAAERKRGAMVIVAGIDFDADTESFLAWYRASGLMRRPL